MHSVALVLAFLSAEATGRFVTGWFWPFAWMASSVGKDKVNKWEFCKLKITTIVGFVIMIQRIFQS